MPEGLRAAPGSRALAGAPALRGGGGFGEVDAERLRVGLGYKALADGLDAAGGFPRQPAAAVLQELPLLDDADGALPLRVLRQVGVDDGARLERQEADGLSGHQA